MIFMEFPLLFVLSAFAFMGFFSLVFWAYRTGRFLYSFFKRLPVTETAVDRIEKGVATIPKMPVAPLTEDQKQSLAEMAEQNDPGSAIEEAAAHAIRAAEEQKAELERLSGEAEFRTPLAHFKQYMDQGRGVRAENAYGVEVDLLNWSTCKSTIGESGEEIEIPVVNVEVVKLHDRETLSHQWARPRVGQKMGLDPNWPHWKLVSLYGKEAVKPEGEVQP